MFSWYKYLIVSLVFSHLGFWSGSLFLIAPFPDLCLLVLFFPIQLFRVISLSRSRQVNLTGIKMFKRHIVEFFKNLENGDFFENA